VFLECHQLIAVPITTGLKKEKSRLSIVMPFQLLPDKKRYMHLAIIHCAVPIAIVAPFQLRQKKRYSHLSVVMPFQLRPEKKIQSSGHHSLRRSNCHVAPFQLRLEKKKIQSSVHCYAIPITTGKKRYSHLATIPCAIPIAIVAPFQLRPEKKDTVVCPLLRRYKYDRKKKMWKKLFLRRRTSLSIVVAPFP
jgi:hypothetical protein